MANFFDYGVFVHIRLLLTVEISEDKSEYAFICPIAKVVFVYTEHLGQSDLTLYGVYIDLSVEDLCDELVKALIQVILRGKAVSVLDHLREVRTHKVYTTVL